MADTVKDSTRSENPKSVFAGVEVLWLTDEDEAAKELTSNGRVAEYVGGTLLKSDRVAASRLKFYGFKGGVVLALSDPDRVVGAGLTLKNYLVRQLAQEHIAAVDASDMVLEHTSTDGTNWVTSWFARHATEGLNEEASGELDRYEDLARSEAVTSHDILFKRALGSRVKDGANVALSVSMGSEDVVQERVPTGLNGLDKALSGGFYGVVTIGATSSLGKTTLLVQVADHIAESGRDVLFVTCEQSAAELVAKSLSRITSASGKVVSAGTILDPARRNLVDTSGLAAAGSKYTKAIAKRLHYMEPTGQPTVKEIEDLARVIADYQEKPPVVFVDYLQLLKPTDPHMTDKQALDEAMMSLRQLSRDLSSPVVVVSSLNRSSYSGEVSMSAFKESGAIEYGSDVLLGMQPYGLHERLKKKSSESVGAKGIAEEEMDKLRSAAVRHIEIPVLKNRSGSIPKDPVPVDFTVATSTFSDVAEIGKPGKFAGKAF